MDPLIKKGRKLKENLTPVIMDELSKFLKSKGHECVGIVGLKDHKFEWCQKDVCTAVLMKQDMAQRQKEEEEFEQKLVSEGHQCIYIMESYPMQVGWCGQTPCKEINSDYWIGPYGIRVPNSVERVRAADGSNSRYKDGSETEMAVRNSITEDKYKSLYAELRDDGFWYYKN